VSTELIITCVALAIEAILLAVVVHQSRKPPKLGTVRLFPYRAATVALSLLILLTAAHLLSLLTGTQVQPRKPKGMR
jgi:hypothetical protein